MHLRFHGFAKPSIWRNVYHICCIQKRGVAFCSYFCHCRRPCETSNVATNELFAYTIYCKCYIRHCLNRRVHSRWIYNCCSRPYCPQYRWFVRCRLPDSQLARPYNRFLQSKLLSHPRLLPENILRSVIQYALCSLLCHTSILSSYATLSSTLSMFKNSKSEKFGSFNSEIEMVTNLLGSLDDSIGSHDTLKYFSRISCDRSQIFRNSRMFNRFAWQSLHICCGSPSSRINYNWEK